MPRENGFFACQNLPAGVRDGAGRSPDTPPEYASRLRRYVRLQLRNLAYPQAFRGCLDAVWSTKLGPRPAP